MNNFSVKKICEKFWKLEREYSLFDQKIDNIFFWKVIRFDLFNSIVKDLNILGQAHTGLKSNLLSKILYFPRFLYYVIINGALKGKYTKKILIFNHPRKVFIDNQYIDVYTEDFVKDKIIDNYLIIDRPYLRRHYSKANQNRKYIENFSSLFEYVRLSIKRFKLSVEELNLINKLKEEIN